MQDYVSSSLELHLFFGRIMKEHALFLEIGFPGIQKEFIEEARWYKNQFEKLLNEVVNISNGYIRPEVLSSGEIVTNYTLNTEMKTEKLTGVPINKNITLMEANMLATHNRNVETISEIDIKKINSHAIKLLDGLINFKQRILDGMLSCTLFTLNYPLLIDHIMREAKLYQSYLKALESGQDINIKDVHQEELFWNQIMMEHALFIRGLLDPTENDLINTANDFANEYDMLLEDVDKALDINNLTEKSYQETLKYRDFKEAGLKGIDNCEIKSIIVPLLADHVLREANHYLRILKD
ncbi:MAG: DUF2935 domain-containing protein [Mollicutes bacterium]|nr:DUF2935 domain-containing protein [Mollicutes bacterium]